MKRIGVVGTSGGWSSEKLADTVYEKTGFRLLIEPDKITLNISDHHAWCGNTDIIKLDALIIKKAGGRYSPDLLDRMEILRFLNERGLKMFSKPLNILRVLDRLSCTVTLQSNGIPMPKTSVTEDVSGALKMVEEYGEAIFKPLYSSKARGMTIIRSGPDACQQVMEFKQDNPIMYIQKRIDHMGRDLGIVFLGGKYLTTYARRSNGSWNTTTHSGGKYEAYSPPEDTIALAKRAQDLFGLDFTCVDVAETPEGPVIFEVSAFGGFRGIEKSSGLDAATLYVDYVLENIS